MKKFYLLDGDLVDLEEFFRANAEDEEINPDAIRAMEPGNKMVFGGGAAATWVLQCVAQSDHTPAPITVHEVTGGFALRSETVGKGYYSSIGHATQRDPHPREGGGVAGEVAAANAKLWSASPVMVKALQQVADLLRKRRPISAREREHLSQVVHAALAEAGIWS